MLELPPYTPDEHETRLVEHFGADAVACPPGETGEGRHIFVCFTNRCGSGYLANLLAATGRVAHAGEAFNHPHVTARADERGLPTLADYCRLVANRKPAGGFGASKVGCRQLFMLAKWNYLGRLFPDPLYIFVTRDDLLDQAISFSIADQTKAWTSRQKPVLDAPEYSRQDIVNRINGISGENALFERFFALNGIRPLRADYDAMIARPRATLDRVADCLKTGPLDHDPQKILLAKQADDRNRDWRHRFLAGETEAPKQSRKAAG